MDVNWLISLIHVSLQVVVVPRLQGRLHQLDEEHDHTQWSHGERCSIAGEKVSRVWYKIVNFSLKIFNFPHSIFKFQNFLYYFKFV